MSKTDTTLKPCPFCGCKLLMLKSNQASGAPSGAWWKVDCPTCGQATSKRRRTKQEAIESWNERAA